MNIPTEIILMIVERIAGFEPTHSSLRDATNFARASRNFYYKDPESEGKIKGAVIKKIYELDVKHNKNHSVIMWRGAELNLPPAIRIAFAAGYKYYWRKTWPVPTPLGHPARSHRELRTVGRFQSAQVLQLEKWLDEQRSYTILHPMDLTRLRILFRARHVPDHIKPDQVRHSRYVTHVPARQPSAQSWGGTAAVAASPYEVALFSRHDATAIQILSTRGIGGSAPHPSACPYSAPIKFQGLRRQPSHAYPMENEVGRTHWALLCARPEVAEFCLSGKLARKAILPEKHQGMEIYPRGETIMHTAALYGYHGCIRLIFNRYPYMISYRDSQGLTPLHYAIAKDNFPTISLLLELGASIDEEMQPGNTPLVLACVEHDYYSALRFIDLGANAGPKRISGGGSLLHVLLRCFLKHDRANEYGNKRPDDHDLRANERTVLVQMLIGKGCNPNETDDFGVTPLMLAARGGLVRDMQLLIDNGARMDILSPWGFSAAGFACDFITWAQDCMLAQTLSQSKHLLEEAVKGVMDVFFNDEVEPCDWFKFNRIVEWIAEKSRNAKGRAESTRRDKFIVHLEEYLKYYLADAAIDMAPEAYAATLLTGLIRNNQEIIFDVNVDEHLWPKIRAHLEAE